MNGPPFLWLCSLCVDERQYVKNGMSLKWYIAVLRHDQPLLVPIVVIIIVVAVDAVVPVRSRSRRVSLSPDVDESMVVGRYRSDIHK